MTTSLQTEALKCAQGCADLIGHLESHPEHAWNTPAVRATNTGVLRAMLGQLAPESPLPFIELTAARVRQVHASSRSESHADIIRAMVQPGAISANVNE